jgi:hypothetical protein
MPISVLHFCPMKFMSARTHTPVVTSKSNFQKMRERKGAIKQQQLRRSQSPATSDGDVSSSPSVGSDDDENAALPKATLSVWIAEGAYNIYICLIMTVALSLRPSNKRPSLHCHSCNPGTYLFPYSF